MNFRQVLIILFSNLLYFTTQLTAQPRLVPTGQLSPIPIPKGVSGAFVGKLNQDIIIAGGSNFPDIPAADGGKKLYYNDIYAYSTQYRTWRKVAELPIPLAYGCSVSTSNSIYLIGGNNTQPSKRVFCFTRHKHTPYRLIELPSLPHEVDNGGAAIIDSVIYVTAGNQPNAGKGIFALDLRNSPLQWKQIGDYPGSVRLQPVVLASGKNLMIVGGYSVDKHKHKVTYSNNILSYNTQLNRWRPLTNIPANFNRCHVGGTGFVDHDRIYLLGGVNAEVFEKAILGQYGNDYLRHQPGWYRFNNRVGIYNCLTRQWNVQPYLKESNRAGSSLLHDKDVIYLIGGELMPGIRTPHSTIYRLHRK